LIAKEPEVVSRKPFASNAFQDHHAWLPLARSQVAILTALLFPIGIANMRGAKFLCHATARFISVINEREVKSL
jgi:hypothetical protein